MLNTTLSLVRMIAITKPKLRLFGHVFGPIFCIAGATAAVRMLSAALHLPRTTGALILQIALSVLLYLGLLVLTRCIGTDEHEILRAIFQSHHRGNAKIARRTDRNIVLHKPRVD